jgi:hypothetical protein
MQRHRVTRDLKEGSSVSVSALAFIMRLPIEGSAAQCGINPQCISLQSLPPLWRMITGMFGEVSGAMLKRGVYFGRSRSRFQRTRRSLNSNVAVNRPHTLRAPLRCAGSGISGQRLPLLRVGPVSWLQDFHSMPAVHPTWLNVNSVCGRFSDWCRLKLLNNDDWLFAESAHTTNKSEAVERV